MISSMILLIGLFKKEDKVSRYIYALSVWMLICFGLTEILSYFHAISCMNLWIGWLICGAVLLFCNVVKYRKSKFNWNFHRNFHITREIVIWLIFALIMIFLAVKTVPYNWDSMTYHLPRIFHWAQNGSINFYATAIDRQVSSPIGGAYVNLHVYVMTNGSDRFVNLLQCCSFLTNGVLVYYIARKIGCSKRWCEIALVLFYTMPIAFAEAFTTQVDNFSALWMVATVYLLLDMMDVDKKLKLDRETFIRVVILSLCVGFGYLTKPSIGIGLFIFALWLLVVVIKRRDSIKHIFAYLLTAGVILGVLLVPGFIRNIETYGALSAPGVGQRQLIGTLEPKAMLVNGVKNLTFNMPTAWVHGSDEILYNGAMGLADLLNVEIDSPEISEDGRTFLVHEAPRYGHDSAINPLIVYLTIVCIIIWSVKNRRNHLGKIQNGYFIVSTISFVVFCALLRWEPFVSRYMVSYLALLCPAIVGQLELYFEEKGTRTGGACAITLLVFMCCTELLGLMYYHGEIAIEGSRYTGYFRNRAEIEGAYRTVADIVNDKGYSNIGLLVGGDTYEYPLTAMLENYDRIEHVNVENPTAVYEDRSFVPEVIIAIDYAIKEDIVSCHGEDFKTVKIIDEKCCLLERME